MNRSLAYILLFSLSFLAMKVQAQDSSMIVVEGKVVDTNQRFPGFNLMVVNQTAGRGAFGQIDGSFKATIGKEDTLVLSAHGYKIVKISFSDSIYRSVYRVSVYLEDIGSDLAPVIVTRQRTLEELTAARTKLEVEDTRIVTGVDVVKSPITALYQKFSKREKAKALVAEMEKDYEKSKILKELFRLYVDNNIINLEDDEFDDFIKFLNISDQMLRSLDDYQLALYIQDKFDHWSRLNDFYFDKSGEGSSPDRSTQKPEED